MVYSVYLLFDKYMFYTLNEYNIYIYNFYMIYLVKVIL